MIEKVKRLIVNEMARFGVGILRQSRRIELESFEIPGLYWALLQEVPAEHVFQFIKLVRESRSQFGQDLFALLSLNFKRGGYFVEFGATNGIEKSNTYLLEKELGWAGCWQSRADHGMSSCGMLETAKLKVAAFGANQVRR